MKNADLPVLQVVLSLICSVVFAAERVYKLESCPQGLSREPLLAQPDLPETNLPLGELSRDQLLLRPVDELPIKQRLKTGLRRLNIRTIEQLIQTPRDDVFIKYYINDLGVGEIEAELRKLGLSFTEKPSEWVALRAPPLDGLSRDQLLLRPVDELPIRERLKKGLRYRNIKTIGQLIQTPRGDVEIIHYINSETIKEVDHALQQLGLTMIPEELPAINQ